MTTRAPAVLKSTSVNKYRVHEEVVIKWTNRWTGRENSLDEVVDEMAEVKLAKTCARQDKEWRGNVDFSGCRATPVIGICRLLHITSTPPPSSTSYTTDCARS